MTLPATLTIERLVHRGFGLARNNKTVWLLSQTAPGDIVDAVAVKEKKGLVEGRIVQIHTPGKDRTTPPCPWFSKCGGCHFQHLLPETQPQYKQEILQETFSRLASHSLHIDRLIHGQTQGYRNRIDLQVVQNQCGFFAPQSHNIVPITSCLIAEPILSDMIPAIKEALQQAKQPLSGRIRMTSNGNKGVVLVLMFSSAPSQDVIQALQSIPSVAGILIKDTGKTLGNTSIVWPTINGAKEPIMASCEADSFGQASTFLNPRLVETILDACAPKQHHRILELYCGAGNCTIALANSGAQITAIDIDKRAIASAQQNLKQHLTDHNVTCIASNASHWKPPHPIDILLADPPRNGLKYAMPSILKASPQKIVLVSCEPSHAARDTKNLIAAGYRPTFTCLLDMFPHTYHMELVLVLER